MPVDEIAEGAVRLLGRAVAELVVEVFFELGCYWLGFASLRLLSFGAYPSSPPTPRQESICKIAGLVEVVAILGVVVWKATQHGAG